MSAPPPKLGPWRVGPLLGKGEFSSVYECWREGGDSTRWAIKVSPFAAPPLKGKERKDQTCCRLLSWENQMYSMHAKGLPCFPRRPLSAYYNPNETDWRYLVLEKLDGGSLKDRLDEIHSSDMAFSIAMRLLTALQHLHSRQFVFRDLKPENVMTLKDDLEGRGVVLVDFGAATKYVDAYGKHFADGGSPVGTPLYMSLPVHMGSPPSRRDDLESLAYLLAWMLNGGILPWSKAKSEAEIQAMKSDPNVISKLCSAGGKEFSFESSLVSRFLKHVKGLNVSDTPDYRLLMKILSEGGGEAEGPIFMRGSSSPKKKKKTASSSSSPRAAKSLSGPIEQEPVKAAKKPRGAKKAAVSSFSSSNQRPRPVMVEEESTSEPEEEEEEVLPIPKRRRSSSSQSKQDESEDKAKTTTTVKSKAGTTSRKSKTTPPPVLNPRRSSKPEVGAKTTRRTSDSNLEVAEERKRESGRHVPQTFTPVVVEEAAGKNPKRVRKSSSTPPPPPSSSAMTTRSSLARSAKSLILEVGFFAGAAALVYASANMKSGS